MGNGATCFVPEMIAPVSFTVLISLDGTIKAHGRPGVSRELLEPAKGVAHRAYRISGRT